MKVRKISRKTRSYILSTLIINLFALPSFAFGSENQEVIPTYFQKFFSNPFFPYFALLCLIFIFTYFISRTLVKSYTVAIDYQAKIDMATRLEKEEKRNTYKSTVKALNFIIPILIFGYSLYIGVAGTANQGFVMEWINLLVRWFHITAGVMWIGASFYFIFLENNLNRTKNVRNELAGNLWAIHGGGFYFLEKYKVAPKEIPEDLHWFKYEAYFTWLSGFALLFIVYYMDAKSFLIDKSVADISVGSAIGIGITIIIAGWIVYDLMCKSPLIKNQKLFALVGFLLLVGVSWFLTQVFNSRAAFLHVGALIGTIMAWNVYFIIIPAQKALVKAAKTGQPLDASLGKKAQQRSLHNNYFTLPVLFIMVSPHFPSTFGHQFNWLVLMAISLASAGIKHYWNLLERGNKKPYILIISIIALFSLALVTSPVFENQLVDKTPVSFQEINEIIQKRCVQCHSANPTDKIWKNAPNGVMYDTPEQIQNMADKIMTRAVRSKSMPLGNSTNMTDEEREVLKRWILQGAKIEE